MTYAYDTKSGRLSTIFNLAAFGYTVVPKVLVSLEFWLFFILHIATFTAYRTGCLSEVVGPTSSHEMDLDWTDVKVLTAITTFFEVFYSNQCYARYLRFHGNTRGMINDVHAFAFVLRCHIGEKARNHLRLSLRYMIAGIILHFYEMQHKMSEMDLRYLQSLGILSPGDVQVMIRMQPQHRSMVTLHWSSLAASKGVKKAEAPSQVQGLLTARLLQVSQSQEEIVDTLALPVPFAYYHILSVMVIVNLGMWAYRMALTESWFAPFVYFFASLIFIGVMELSSEMSDPFGIDEVDFPLDRWMGEMVESVVALTESDCIFNPGNVAFERAFDEEIPMRFGIPDFRILTEDDKRHSTVVDGTLPLARSKPPTVPAPHSPNCTPCSGAPRPSLPMNSPHSETSYTALDPHSLMLEERGGMEAMEMPPHDFQQRDMHMVQSEHRGNCLGKMRRCMQ